MPIENEKIIENLGAVAKEVKDFTINSNSKIEKLEKKSDELENNTNNFAKQIEQLKRENLEISNRVEEISVKSTNPLDGSGEIEKKYLSNLDEVFRNFAYGNPEIKSEFLENAEKYATILAKRSNLANEAREQKFVKASMIDASHTAFPILEVKSSAQNTYTGTDGGFAVAPAKRLPTYEIYGEKIGLYNLANKVPTTTNQVERLVTRAVEKGFWESEFGSDKKIGFGMDKITIGTSIVKGSVPMARTFVEDYQGNLYSYLYPSLTETLNNSIEEALFIGNGVNGMPRGIAMYSELGDDETYAINKLKTVSVSDASDLLNNIIKYSVLGKTAKKDLLMNNATLAELLLLKDSEGRPLVQPNMLMDGAKWKIGGMNVYVSDFCPDFNTSGNKAVFLGDFNRAYDVVERTGKVVEYNPYFNNNEVIHYMLRQRVGGAVKGFDSLIVFKKA